MSRGFRLVVLLLGVTAWGCATVMTGTTESVHIDSVPPDATVTVDGDTYRTPAVLTLSRAQSHSVTVSKDGFLTVRRVISRVGNPAAAGSALVGGMVFLAVDQGTGGAFRLHPTSVGSEGTVRQFGQFDSVAGDGSRGRNNDGSPPGCSPAELSELAHRPWETAL